MVDCYNTTKNAAHGCAGGYETKALEYVMTTGGQMSEENYPYLETDWINETTHPKRDCKFNIS